MHVRAPIGRPFVATLITLALGFGLLGMPTAQAASKPTVGSLTPACGPVGTSVTIRGNHFIGATRVEFNGVDQTTFDVESDGKITTTVPSGATTGKIAVTNPDGTGTSADDFIVSSSCAPDITGFSPMSGPVGTSVTINGTKFVNTSAVKFNGTNASPFSWNPSGTQLTTTVPSGATTGQISVTTPAGTATSSNTFTLQEAFHDRSVSLELRRHLVARGFVSAEGGFAACYQSVAVAIQRKVGGIWRTIRSTLTDSSGFYRRFIPDREGRYRTLVRRVELTNDVCGRAVSPVRFNT